MYGTSRGRAIAALVAPPGVDRPFLGLAILSLIMSATLPMFELHSALLLTLLLIAPIASDSSLELFVVAAVILLLLLVPLLLLLELELFLVDGRLGAFEVLCADLAVSFVVVVSHELLLLLLELFDVVTLVEVVVDALNKACVIFADLVVADVGTVDASVGVVGDVLGVGNDAGVELPEAMVTCRFKGTLSKLAALESMVVNADSMSVFPLFKSIKICLIRVLCSYIEILSRSTEVI